MQRNESQGTDALEIKQSKTAVVFLVANLLTSSLCFVNDGLGLAALIVMNGMLANYLHDLGKSRRPGSNTLNTVYSFFSSQANIPSNDLENAYRNVINGGAAVFDEVGSKLNEADRQRYTR